MIVFITVPLQRLRSMIRRQVDIDMPLVTDAQGYPLVAEEIAATLSRHGVKVAPTTPDWTVTAPSRILSRLGGPSFDAYVPRRFTQFQGPRLEVMLYPNGLLLRGSEQETAWAHGLLVEALTDAPAYQTFDPAAQDIERQSDGCRRSLGRIRRRMRGRGLSRAAWTRSCERFVSCPSVMTSGKSFSAMPSSWTARFEDARSFSRPLRRTTEQQTLPKEE